MKKLRYMHNYDEQLHIHTLFPTTNGGSNYSNDF